MRKSFMKFAKTTRNPPIGGKISSSCLEAVAIAAGYISNREMNKSAALVDRDGCMISDQIGEQKVTSEDDNLVKDGVDKSNYAEIYVKLLSGDTLVVNANLNGTESDLKSEIFRKTGLQVDACRFTCGKQIILKDRCLSDNGVAAYSTVQIVLRLRGGMNDEHGQGAVLSDEEVAPVKEASKKSGRGGDTKSKDALQAARDNKPKRDAETVAAEAAKAAEKVLREQAAADQVLKSAETKAAKQADKALKTDQ